MPADRRTLLRYSVSALPLAGFLLPRSAAAFSLEDVAPQSGLGFDIANRCGSDGSHATQASDLQQRLAATGGTPGTTRSETITCPICGCPITASFTYPS